MRTNTCRSTLKLRMAYIGKKHSTAARSLVCIETYRRNTARCSTFPGFRALRCSWFFVCVCSTALPEEPRLQTTPAARHCLSVKKLPSRSGDLSFTPLYNELFVCFSISSWKRASWATADNARKTKPEGYFQQPKTDMCDLVFLWD